MRNTTHLQREIAKLKNRIIELSSEVEVILDWSFEALVERKPITSKELRDRDHHIDEMEVDVEEECLKIMALYQPVAADLRQVIGILKMNNDLERIGDLAVNIGEYAEELARRPRVEVPPEFRIMFDDAREMLRDSMDAMMNPSAEVALSVCLRDDKVDKMNVEVIESIRNQIHDGEANTDALLFLISASRSIERIADYATNIAEDVYYMVQGTIIRHHIATVLEEGEDRGQP